MRVTYLDHSSFMLELEKHILIFDYFRGQLPAVTSSKEILFFSSHVHPDHYSLDIFLTLKQPERATYVISKDIWNKHKKVLQQKIDNGFKIQILSSNETRTLESCKIKTFKSTDEGVAFLVELEGKTIYHAGDLNWWHWMGESKAYNNNMAADYKREIDSMKGVSIDLVFFPLDPRLEEAYCYGLDYFLQQTNTKYIFPMHCWDRYEIIEKYKSKQLPGEDNVVMSIKSKGEVFEIN